MMTLFFSCQKEENEIIQNDNVSSISKVSPLTSLIMRVTQNPTSNDNVMDNSSCFHVQLPVTVIVNGQQITVSSETDYQLVQDAIDAFSTDDDIVNFIYPITIQFQNFTTLTLNNSDDLDDVLDDCDEDDGFDEIDCVTLVYPITINTYDSNNQLAETIVISSNVQLYNFLANLDFNEFISIQFPISFINSNGVEITITGNNELEDAIEDAIGDCNNSGSGGGNNNLDLEDLLVSGTWYVSYYFHNQDETALYSSYTFTFSSNNNLLASGPQTVNGVWSHYIENGDEILELDFAGGTLSDLDDEWEVIEYSTTQIRTKSSNDYLYLTKN